MRGAQLGEGAQLAAALAEVAGNKVPGLSAALVRGERVLWSGAAGLADLDSATPAQTSTVYLWFSMTKIATATCVVQLAERARLDLDEPVTRYVPEFPHPAGSVPVTIRHLLSHSSGLANPIPVRWVHPASSAGPDRREFALRLLHRYRKLKGTPSASASYSNLGYVVLGEVVAAASGESYEDYLCENLLAPLGMVRSDFIYREDLVEEAATGYQVRLSPLTPLYRLMLPKGIIGKPAGRFVSFNRFYVDGPAYGGLLGSVEDAARFLGLHTSAGALGGGGVLSAAGVASMQKITARGRKLDVGLGWFRRHADQDIGTPYVEHLGGGGGFFNMMRLFPELDAGLVVMGNATRYEHRTCGSGSVPRRHGAKRLVLVGKLPGRGVARMGRYRTACARNSIP